MTLPKLPRSKYTGMQHRGCYIGTVYTQEQMREYARKAVAAEREACAKTAEDMCEYGKPYSAAAAIRARDQ